MWNNHVTLLLVVLVKHKNTILFVFQTFQQVTTRSFTNNTIKFTVSNNGTEWTSDFGNDSLVLSVQDLDENLTTSSLEIPLAAWSLLLSQRQELLENQLPRVHKTPNQQVIIEMGEDVLSCCGAQDTGTRGYELSDLEDIKFRWEYSSVVVDSFN